MRAKKLFGQKEFNDRRDPPLYVSIFPTLPNLNTEVWHGARTLGNRCSPEESRKASSSPCLLCPSKKYVMYTNSTSVLNYQPSVKEFAICWNRLYYNNGCNSAQVETKKKLSKIIDNLNTWGNNLLLNYCNILQKSSWSKYPRTKQNYWINHDYSYLLTSAAWSLIWASLASLAASVSFSRDCRIIMIKIRA